jgi:hypothetical protein
MPESLGGSTAIPCHISYNNEFSLAKIDVVHR